MKEETRIDGPWKDDDTIRYIPRQVRGISLLPWQQEIVDNASVWDTRSINILIDTEGSIGKSTLSSYVGAHGLGRKLPYCNDYKDIMRIVMDAPKSRLYLIDMPRALKKDALHGFFSGIESLKDGYAFDDRYKFKDEHFDCPNIWVFSNKVPDHEYLSKDRWRYWRVVGQRLCKYNPGKSLLDAAALAADGSS